MVGVNRGAEDSALKRASVAMVAGVGTAGRTSKRVAKKNVMKGLAYFLRTNMAFISMLLRDTGAALDGGGSVACCDLAVMAAAVPPTCLPCDCCFARILGAGNGRAWGHAEDMRATCESFAPERR